MPPRKKKHGRQFILEFFLNLPADDGDEELLNGHVLFKYPWAQCCTDRAARIAHKTKSNVDQVPYQKSSVNDAG